MSLGSVIGVIGPTVGTVHLGNADIGIDLVPVITSKDFSLPSTRLFGVLKDVMSSVPEGTNKYRMAQSTVLLMDVCQRLPWQVKSIPPPDEIPDNPFPNPANPGTTFRFKVAGPGVVRIAVFDIAGRRIKSETVRVSVSGEQEFYWDGRDDRGREIASGVYAFKIETQNATYSGKVTLIK